MKGDFIGFSFDGIHCSHLGINHVSSSDRYDEDLFPEIKDKTIEIPNNHGEYYYGSTYGTRTFEIEFAYDSITETQFRQIRRLFSTSKICELIFDERPYKVYHAKIESPLEMSYICFDERERYPGDTIPQGGLRYVDGPVSTIPAIVGEATAGAPRVKEDITPWVYTGKKERIYKGEGTISLICYYPFAHQLFKELELYEQAGEQFGNLFTNYTNIDEWAASSGILTHQQREDYGIDKVGNSENNLYTYDIPVYNPGDLNTGFCLYIPFNNGKINGKILPNSEISDIIINGDEKVLVLDSIQQKGDDTGILINTTNHLIEGVIFSQIANLHDYRTPSWKTTGNLYNEYIKAGDFPYIKRNDWYLDNVLNQPQCIHIACAETDGISIYYDYLYF